MYVCNGTVYIVIPRGTFLFNYINKKPLFLSFNKRRCSPNVNMVIRVLR